MSMVPVAQKCLVVTGTVAVIIAGPATLVVHALVFPLISGIVVRAARVITVSGPEAIIPTTIAIIIVSCTVCVAKVTWRPLPGIDVQVLPRRRPGIVPSAHGEVSSQSSIFGTVAVVLPIPTQGAGHVFTLPRSVKVVSLIIWVAVPVAENRWFMIPPSTGGSCSMIFVHSEGQARWRKR